MAQGKSQASRPASDSGDDPLDKVRDAVREDRRKIAYVPVASLELKRSSSRLQKVYSR